MRRETEFAIQKGSAREMSQRNQQTTRANSRERICALVFNVTSEFTMRPSSAEFNNVLRTLGEGSGL